jgi:hypothetical protein
MGWQSVKVVVKDQLSERTNDGRAPENADEDCVFVSAASAVEALTGIFTSGDELKDLAKGERYQGGGNAAWLVKILARAPWRVKLTPHNGTRAQLLAVIREQIKAGHPVMITIPSYAGGKSSRAKLLSKPAPANPRHPGGSHVVLICGIDDSDSGDAEAMNPWHGWRERMPIAWWLKMICYGQVWSLERMTEEPALPTGWTWDGSVLTAPSGVKSVGAIGAKVRADLLLNIWQGGYPRKPQWLSTSGAAVQQFGSCTLLADASGVRYATEAELAELLSQLQPAA